MKKQKIYFVPVGVSGITYYEKLIPHLLNSYDAGFLLIGYDDSSFQQMIDRCREEHYEYYVINLGSKRRRGVRVPIFSPLKKMFTHKKECRVFLETMHPDKIVFDKTKRPHNAMAHEANRRGVETIRLQWSFLFSPENSFTLRTPAASFIARIYYRVIQYAYDCIGFLQGDGWNMSRGSAVTPQKLGVIDESAKKLLLKEFYSPPKKVRVVGTLEMQEMYELSERVRSDMALIKDFQKKYTIHSGKINILVLGFRFTRVISTDGKRALSKEEHLACFKNIFTDIQKIFSPQKAHILFKTHQGDEGVDMYESYTLPGVTVYGDEAKTDELMCVSDVCIIDPWTTANYLVLASGISAICVDFAPVQGRVAPQESFKIKEIVRTRERFSEMLQDFKNGVLEKQYDSEGINMRSAQKIIELINEK